MANEKEILDLASLDNDALVAELKSMTNEYAQMKFDHTVKGLSNPMEIRSLRRDIARANTEMRKREMAIMTPEELAMRSKIRARRRRR